MGQFTSSYQNDVISCQSSCQNTIGCTGFAYKKDALHCWLKLAKLSQSNASYSSDSNMYCGFINPNYHQINWNGNNYAAFCDHNGSDIQNYTNIVTPKDCSDLCSNNSFCTHVVYHPFDKNQGCYLKGGNVSQSSFFQTDNPYSCNIIRNYPNTVQWNRIIDRLVNERLVGKFCLFVGTDLKRSMQPDVRSCQTSCFNTIGCTAFVYSQNTSTCSLKFARLTMGDAKYVSDPNMYCGIQNSNYQQLNWNGLDYASNSYAAFCDHPGSDIQNYTNIKSAEDCFTICLNNSSCSHIVYHPFDQNGQCFLKGGNVTRYSFSLVMNPYSCNIVRLIPNTIQWNGLVGQFCDFQDTSDFFRSNFTKDLESCKQWCIYHWMHSFCLSNKYITLLYKNTKV